jgi:hypothetical protein
MITRNEKLTHRETIERFLSEQGITKFHLSYTGGDYQDPLVAFALPDKLRFLDQFGYDLLSDADRLADLLGWTLYRDVAAVTSEYRAELMAEVGATEANFVSWEFVQ